MMIGIVGHGFVGKAVDFGFTCNKVVIDPKYGSSVGNIPNPKGSRPSMFFVCVPTPMGEDGNADISIITEVVQDLHVHYPEAIVVIKSTVTPHTIEKLSRIHNHIVANPEFLSERNANHDFVNPPMLVLGGHQKDVDLVEKAYRLHTTCALCPVFKMDLLSACMIKYTINSFLATKVTFFNQLKEAFDRSGAEISWDHFTSILANDSRIGSTHMQVPGPDGRYGWGGACFSKDTMALLLYADTIGVDLSLLGHAIFENQKVRRHYDTLDDREKEQNIKFDINI